MELPKGNTREDIKRREKFIKDFYVQWISIHNDKKLWNDDLRSYIHIKFISIDETREKAARKYESTIAVTRLDELLSKSKKITEVPIKKGTKNQKPFEKMVVMQLDNIKMTVGLQRSTNQYVQYCISTI